MHTADYTIRQNEKTGELYIQIPENENTDLITQYMAIKGKVHCTKRKRGNFIKQWSYIKKQK